MLKRCCSYFFCCCCWFCFTFQKNEIMSHSRTMPLFGVRILSIDFICANQIEIILGFIITIPLCGSHAAIQFAQLWLIHHTMLAPICAELYITIHSTLCIVYRRKRMHHHHHRIQKTDCVCFIINCPLMPAKS